MKKLSSRAIAAITNGVLVLILAVVGVICFAPVASPASGTDERAVYRGRSEDGVSLMFNVYWGTEETLEILKILDEYGAKATFFLGGSWADDNLACVREIAQRGHEIGSHGYFHRDHSALSREDNLTEIRASVELISRAAETEVTLFAPPSGAYGEAALDAAEQLGLKTIMWSRDTVDWRDKDADVCFRRATENVTGGELILMHPMEHTAAALPRILEFYRQNGLRAITVGENIG